MDGCEDANALNEIIAHGEMCEGGLFTVTIELDAETSDRDLQEDFESRGLSRILYVTHAILL